MRDVTLGTLPECDLCRSKGDTRFPSRPAEYDSPIDGGPWGYLCLECFDSHGSESLASHLVT